MGEMGEVGRIGHPDRLIVDRLENDYAVVETEQGAIVDLPRWALPPTTREGDVIAVERDADGDTIRYWIDRAATAAVRGEAEERLRRLRRGDPGGSMNL